jgi:hypothetical protein
MVTTIEVRLRIFSSSKENPHATVFFVIWCIVQFPLKIATPLLLYLHKRAAVLA